MRGPGTHSLYLAFQLLRWAAGLVLLLWLAAFLLDLAGWSLWLIWLALMALVALAGIMQAVLYFASRGDYGSFDLEHWAGASLPPRKAAGRPLLAYGLTSKGRLAVSEAFPLRPHMLVLASTGSGKTTSLIRPNILLHCGATIALDVKGEIVAADAAALAASGRQVLVFDPEEVIKKLPDGVGRVGLNLSAGWQAGGGDWRLKLAQSMVDLIFIEQSAEPAFAGSTRTLGRAAIAAAIAQAAERDLFARLSEAARMAPRQLQSLYKKHHKDCSADLAALIEGGANFLVSGNERLIHSALTGMQRQLEFLQTARVAKALDGDFAIDRLLAADSRTALFVALPASRLAYYAPMLRIIFGQLGALAENRAAAATPANLLVAIDEAASLERAEWLLRSAALHRGFGISYLLAFQSCPQIERIYGQSGLAELMGNCASVFLGVRDLATAEEISQALGQTTSYTTARTAGGSINERQLPQPVASPQQILQMEQDQLIVCPPNQKATRLYRAHPGVVAGGK